MFQLDQVKIHQMETMNLMATEGAFLHPLPLPLVRQVVVDLGLEPVPDWESYPLEIGLEDQLTTMILQRNPVLPPFQEIEEDQLLLTEYLSHQ